MQHTLYVQLIQVYRGLIVQCVPHYGNHFAHLLRLGLTIL